MLPSWDGMITNTTERKYDTVVNVTCADERVFKDGDSVKVTRCSLQGEWEPPVPACAGECPCGLFLRLLAAY